MNIPAALGDGQYYFIYDTDNDGSLSDESPTALTDQGGNIWKNTVDFGAGGLFTLATTEQPAANSLTPADNSVNVALDSNLIIHFSRAVTGHSGTITIKKAADDSTVETLTANGPRVSGQGTATITINPTANLNPSTDYYILITDTAFADQDTAYFPGMSNPSSWNFRTVSADTDGDGVDSAVENAGPNNGDGNGDGIADADQTSVTSLPNPVVGGGAYITLEAEGDCRQLSDVSVVAADDLSHQDGSLIYPVGLVDFKLICDNPGDAAQITIYYDQAYDTSSWQIRKFINSTYSSIEDADIATATIGGHQVTTLTYELVDGGPLDADGSADGDIVDPVGPAVLAAATTPTPTPTPDPNGPLPDTGTILLSTGILGLAMALIGLILNPTTRRRLNPRK